MQKLGTYFDKKKFSFYTLFYTEHSGMLIKKRHKFLNKILRYSGFIVLFLIMGILFLLTSCKEEQVLKSIENGGGIYKTLFLNNKNYLTNYHK